MYAVIQTGGKQYRVHPGDKIAVERLPGQAGEPVEFHEVLLVADEETVAVGRPLISGAKVTAEIVEQSLGEKLIVFKFRRRKNYRRKRGHRQEYTTIKINSVTTP